MENVYAIFEEMAPDPNQVVDETEATGGEKEEKVIKQGKDWFFSAGDL